MWGRCAGVCSGIFSKRRTGVLLLWDFIVVNLRNILGHIRNRQRREEEEERERARERERDQGCTGST